MGLLTAGGGVELRQRLGTDWLFHQAVEVQALDFKETEARDFADAQDGSRTSLEVGLRHELTGDLTATLSYGFTYRTAAADFEAFVGHRLRGGASLAYPTPFAITRRESRLRFGAALDLADYDGPNPTYSASEVREDREWAVDLSNALALSEALSLDPEPQLQPASLQPRQLRTGQRRSRARRQLPLLSLPRPEGAPR